MKILLAVDSSRYSRWAVDFLLELPLKDQPQITVLHVVELPSYKVPMTVNLAARKEYITKLRGRKLDEAKKFVTEYEKRIRHRFNTVTSETAVANVAEKIIDKSTREGMDLIIIGSRGLSDISAFFLGGVSQRVITYSPCSVLVVKKRVRTLRRILLAVDGSSYSDASVNFLKSNFEAQGREVTVLNVWDSFSDLPGRPDFLGRYKDELEGAGFKTRPVTARGNPAEAIIEEAVHRKTGLIVMGSKGIVGLRKFLMGRTTRKVVTYGETAVLVLRGV